MSSSSRSLGELLIKRNVLSRDQLELTLEREAQTGRSLVELLLVDRLVAERDLVGAMAAQIGLGCWNPQLSPIPLMVKGLLPEPLARQLPAVAVGIEGANLVVAFADVPGGETVAEVEKSTGWSVSPVLAIRSDVQRALLDSYGAGADDEAGEEGDGHQRHLGELLSMLVQRGGSDLHLVADLSPHLRVHGSLQPAPGWPPLTASELRELIYAVLSQQQRERFEAAKELDTSYLVPGIGRFRLNVFFQRNAVGAVLRAIPFEVVPLDELGVPTVLRDLTVLPRGLVLVTGPTGSGKSTTLASMVDAINQDRAVHIMTVEDPIEFVHHSKRAVINQREVGEDTFSFAEALKHVLRQDPDVILVGELRDLETISAAITAAETGHLVFGTLHTQDAPQSIDRIIDVFPSSQQQQVRVQLAASLQAVVTQQLLATRDGNGRVVACEVMVATPAIRNLIREGKVHQVYSAIQAGGKYGMQTMDMSLAALAAAGRITMETARAACHDETDLLRLVGGR